MWFQSFLKKKDMVSVLDMHILVVYLQFAEHNNKGG